MRRAFAGLIPTLDVPQLRQNLVEELNRGLAPPHAVVRHDHDATVGPDPFEEPGHHLVGVLVHRAHPLLVGGVVLPCVVGDLVGGLHHVHEDVPRLAVEHL